MRFLEKIWDDTMGGPQPDRGLGMLRKSNTFIEGRSSSSKAIPITSASNRPQLQRSQSMDGEPSSLPSTPSSVSTSPSSTPRGKDNVWRSVFHPGSNMATKTIGSEKFDNADPRSPTVYDWLYSNETRSKWR